MNKINNCKGLQRMENININQLFWFAQIVLFWIAIMVAIKKG